MNDQKPTAGDDELTVTLNGSTRLHVIIGDPIAQVKSPFGMTAKLVDAHHNALVVPMRVQADTLAAFVNAMAQVENVESLIVTIPHKFACFSLCAETSARAKLLGAVQSMRKRPGGGWYGENYDGVSFVTAARENGAQIEGTRALLVGAGGAGSAIALALLDAGVAELAVWDPDETRLRSLIARLETVARVPVSVGSANPEGYGFIANATPLGMREGDPLPVDVSRLDARMFVGCVITSPAVSPLIDAARRAGCGTSTGKDMSNQAQKLGIAFALNT